MRLLLVEYDTDTAHRLAKGLGESGFRVDVADNGLTGRHFVEQQSYDLIVLDVMLPGLNSWQLLQLIRQRGTTPVLFLTARDSMEDRLRGLELGADDYLLKPFSLEELRERVQTLLRRGPTGTADHYNLSDLDVDVQRQRVSRGGQRISLSDQEFELLQLLISRQGSVVSRSLIASQVFNNNAEKVDIAIHRLRSKIDERYSPKLIHGVGQVGYQMGVLDE